DADVLAVEARQKHLAAVLRLQQRTEDVRHLEPTLVIDPRDLMASKHARLRPSPPLFPTKIHPNVTVRLNRMSTAKSTPSVIYASAWAPTSESPRRSRQRWYHPPFP